MWKPDTATVERANVTALARELGLPGYPELHAWSVADRPGFWGKVVERLGIVFASPPSAILAEGSTPERPEWLPGALLNVVATCFDRADPDAAAVVHASGGGLHRVTYRELEGLVGRVVSGLAGSGFGAGDRIAIAMPMTLEAVAAYLGIVASGGVVVSVADSFAADEMAVRLRLTGATAVVTQDRVTRGGRELPMYDKVVGAGAERCIVVDTGAGVGYRTEDVTWERFLGEPAPLVPVVAPPDGDTNVLFSSGTTGDPKAIPWTHLTPIKAAMDAHFHHDIQPGDVAAWPTNLGWMMGPWLIYATLMNGAAMALYDDAPTGSGFGRFVQDAGVTMLGVVPSLVASWRASRCMEGLDWSAIRCFSSTGEASNPDDMAWLMSLAGGRPVIEYCGGTEIGGGYITATTVQASVPATFTTPALGLDLRILDEEGRPDDSGEVFLVPPSIGLSTRLLNKDHHQAYYAGVPDAGLPLRRHGDHLARLPDGRYRALGRIDDTMNLGGIKVGSAELERAMAGVAGVSEVAAVAVPPPGGGPSRLVVYAVAPEADPAALKPALQEAVSRRLNPLFRVHDVVAVDVLPRTASNKVMRRTLRDTYRSP